MFEPHTNCHSFDLLTDPPAANVHEYHVPVTGQTVVILNNGYPVVLPDQYYINGLMDINAYWYYVPLDKPAIEYPIDVGPSVPEPGALALLLVGCIFALLFRRKPCV